MAINKEREIMLQILDILRKEMPYLWNKGDKDYYIRNIREEGYRVLLEMYRNADETATMKTLKRKLDNMRTNFFKELKKVQESKQYGAETEDVYTPSLWYFKAFSFLESTTEPCRTIKDNLENEDSSLSSVEYNFNHRSDSASTSNYKLNKKQKKEILSKKQENMHDNADCLMSPKEEDWEVIGKSIGLQLRDVNKRQLIIARKIISDIIYYANLDKLSEDSYVVVGPANGPLASSPLVPNIKAEMSTHPIRYSKNT